MVIELFAISLDPTEFAEILAALTALFAIFAFDTTLLSKCIVSIDPDTSSELSTEFAPIRSAVIVPLGICVAVTEFCPSSEVPIALAATLAAVIALSATFAFVTLELARCIASILPVTSSELSTEFAAS